MNSINMIAPYKENGIWRFDDKHKGLKGEPFIGETNNIIDSLIHNSLYVDEDDKINIYFSSENFLGCEFVLTRAGYELNGAWYRLGNSDDALEGWLCPATLRYFEDFPERIYISLFTKDRK